jgi:hypothetical protein
VENLSQQWVPLFVRATQPILPGNQRLIERKGLAFTHPKWQIILRRDLLPASVWVVCGAGMRTRPDR